MLETLSVAIGAFIFTNMDDLLLLTLLFTSTYQARNIVIGQLLGIGALTILSITGALASIWVVGKLDINRGLIGLLGLIPIYYGIKSLFDSSDDGGTIAEGKIGLEQILSVAVITISNGGDNVGVYVPIFASIPITQIIQMGIVFLVMTLLWCYFGYAASHVTRHVGERHFGLENVTESLSRLLPYVLILIGIYVIWVNNFRQ